MAKVLRKEGTRESWQRKSENREKMRRTELAKEKQEKENTSRKGKEKGKKSKGKKSKKMFQSNRLRCYSCTIRCQDQSRIERQTRWVYVWHTQTSCSQNLYSGEESAFLREMCRPAIISSELSCSSQFRLWIFRHWWTPSTQIFCFLFYDFDYYSFNL